MKKLLKYLIPAFIVGAVLASAANAQVSTPNFFKKVGNNIYPVTNTSTIIGSSTYDGAFKNLNVSGTCTGCGGGGSSSLTSTYVGFGNGSNALTGTSTLTYSNGVLYSQLIEGIAYADQYSGADIGAKINAAYAALPSTGGTIFVPGGTYSYTNGILITTAGKIAKLVGAGGSGFYTAGGTTLIYTATSGTAYTYDVAGYSSAGVGLFDLSLVGPAGVAGIGSSVIGSTVGIKAGGANGEFGFNIQGVQVSGFGTALLIYQNASFLNMTNSVLQKNGRNIDNPSVSGANGENMRVSNSILADANSASGGSISAFCVDVQQSGNVQWTFNNTSFDDCQVYSNQFGGTANIWNFTDDHWEDPNTGQSAYSYIVTQPSAAGAAATVINIKGGDMMQDMTSGAGNEFIQYGGSLILDGLTVDVNNNVGTPMNDVATPLNGGAVISWHGLQQKSLNTSAATAATYVYGSQPFSTDGLGFGTTTASFSFSTSTLVFGFNPTDPQGNKYSTSTSGITGLTTNFVPVASSSNTLANSNIVSVPATATSTQYKKISFVQTVVSAGTSTGVTTTITGVAAGDLLVIGWEETNNVANATTTDDNGTPVFAASTTWHSNAHDNVYYIANAAAGTHNVHVAWSGSVLFQNLIVTEYSNVATSSPLDKIATSTCTSCGSGPITSPVMISTLPNEMALGQGGSAGDTISAGTGFTLRNSTINTEDNATSSMAAGASVSTTFNGYAGADWSDIGTLWKPAVSGTIAALPAFAGIGITSPTSTWVIGGSLGFTNNILSVSSTIGVTSSSFQVFTAAALPATSTLPTIASSQGQFISFKNRSTSTLQIQAATSSATDFIWQSGTNATATFYLLSPGSSTAFQNDGTYWDQLWK